MRAPLMSDLTNKRRKPDPPRANPAKRSSRRPYAAVDAREELPDSDAR